MSCKFTGTTVARFLALLLAMLLPKAASASHLSSPGKAISGANALADVALLERVLTVLHPGLDRYVPRSDIEAGFSALRQAVEGGTTDAAMYLEVSRLLALIRCDHTKAEYPESLRDFREHNPTFLPVQTRIFGDRLFIGATVASGLAVGEEILSINGIDAATLIREVEALISIDGFTEFARADEAERSSEYLGSGIDTFMPLIHGFVDQFEFLVRAADDGPARTVTEPALTLGAYEAIDPSDAARNFKDAVHVQLLDDRTALLRVDTFVNYREPVDPDETFSGIMRDLNNAGVKHLIVDLRFNGGGSDDATQSLFRHLISSPVAVRQRGEVKTVPIPDDVKRAVTTWDMSVLDTPASALTRAPSGMWRLPGPDEILVEPAPDRFNGRVTALSSRGNASGSTLLLAALQKHGGVRIVGEPTGGSVEGPTAGVIAFCRLPACGITVRVPLIRTYSGNSPSEPGMGVRPDEIVWRTIEAFRAGRDEALHAAKD